MARVVSKASTKSRGSYQKGYQLGNKGGAAPDGGETPAVKGDKVSAALKGGGGGKGKADTAAGMNVSYGDTLPVSDLKTVADFGAKPSKTSTKVLGAGKAVDYAKQKGDSGSGFNYGKRR